MLCERRTKLLNEVIAQDHHRCNKTDDAFDTFVHALHGRDEHSARKLALGKACSELGQGLLATLLVLGKLSQVKELSKTNVAG
eukprot:3357220-Amphidinium_carterae.1